MNPIIYINKGDPVKAYYHFCTWFLSAYNMESIASLLPVVSLSDLEGAHSVYIPNCYIYNPKSHKVCLQTPQSDGSVKLPELTLALFEKLFVQNNCRYQPMDEKDAQRYADNFQLLHYCIVRLIKHTYLLSGRYDKSMHSFHTTNNCNLYHLKNGFLSELLSLPLIRVDHSLFIPISSIPRKSIPKGLVQQIKELRSHNKQQPKKPVPKPPYQLLTTDYILSKDKAFAPAVRKSNYDVSIPVIKQQCFDNQAATIDKPYIRFHDHYLIWDGQLTCKMVGDAASDALCKLIPCAISDSAKRHASTNLTAFLYMVSQGNCKFIDELARLLANCFLNNHTAGYATVIHFSKSSTQALNALLALIPDDKIPLFDNSRVGLDTLYTEQALAKHAGCCAMLTSIPTLLVDNTEKQTFTKKVIQNKQIVKKDKLFGALWFVPTLHTIILAGPADDVHKLRALYPIKELSLPDSASADLPQLSGNDIQWFYYNLIPYGMKLLLGKSGQSSPTVAEADPNQIYLDFIDQCCELESGIEMTFADVYAAFDRYCISRLGKRYLSHPRLKSYLTDRQGITCGRPHHDRNGKNPHCFIGLRVVADKLAKATLAASTKTAEEMSTQQFQEHLETISHVLDGLEIHKPKVRIVRAGGSSLDNPE